MSQNLLGVKPAPGAGGAGFARVEIIPMLTESLPSVAGIVPSVLGFFEVSFDLRKREANLSLPVGMDSARLELALLPSQPALRTGSIQLNGLPIISAQATSAAGKLILEGLPSGSHHISWAVENTGAFPYNP